MEWLHCNYCYSLERSAGENQQFFIANCGQVLCGRCTDGSPAKCLFHEHECSYTAVNALKREHEALFTNVIQLMQKNLKYLEFQMNQKSSLMTYLLSKLEKYNVQKEEIARLKSECRRHREEKNALKNELIAKHDEIRQLQYRNQQLVHQIQQNQQQNARHSQSSSSGYFSDPPANAASLFGASSASQQQSFSPLANQAGAGVFTPPKPVAHRIYRDGGYHLETPKRKSPMQSPSSDMTTPTASGLQRAGSRTVFLPGDKDRGTSPFSRIGLQRLNLKSTPNFGSSGNTPRRASRVGIFGHYM